MYTNKFRSTLVACVLLVLLLFPAQYTYASWFDDVTSFFEKVWVHIFGTDNTDSLEPSTESVSAPVLEPEKLDPVVVSDAPAVPLPPVRPDISPELPLSPQTVSPAFVTQTVQANRALTVEVAPENVWDNGIPSVTGPVVVGVMDWGDGTKTDVLALVTADNVVAEHTYNIDGTYVLAFTNQDGQRVQLPQVVATPTGVRYAVSDISSVTQKMVDPIPAAIDDEYTEYTITLKTGMVYIVEGYGMAPRGMLLERLAQTGYSGTLEAFMSMLR